MRAAGAKVRVYQCHESVGLYGGGALIVGRVARHAHARVVRHIVGRLLLANLNRYAEVEGVF